MRTARPAALGLSCLLAVVALSCGADDRAASARPGPSTQAPSTTTAPTTAPERDPAALVEPLARVMEERGDLHPVVSPDGLTVQYGVTVRHYSPEQLEGILSDPTVEGWNPGACDDECHQGTFAAVVADDLLGAFRDADVALTMNTAVLGPNTLAGVEFPPDLEGLEYVSVHDPGDNPGYQGLDWTTWLVFVEEHEGRPRVAGLAQYAWTP
ncbi:MAG: hypothetical protein ACRD0C_11885 [Acidimicrobiia bacterium]